jgi:tetratricopeptide (TPR) repeat protein
MHFLHKPFVHILLIVVLGLIAYSNTFHSPFIFDDVVVIKENPIIRDLGFYLEPSRAEAFKGTFQYQSFKNRYIGSLTFALNYKLHGLHVFGYHVVNLAIHIMNALLLYFFIVLSFTTPCLDKSKIRDYSRQVALFGALFFACHPIQTEAVTYIWQRVTSLATMFYLLSFLLYIKARLVQTDAIDIKKKGYPSPATALMYYIFSLLAALLAMKTKQISFTLPIMIVLYEFMFFQGDRKKRILFLIPFLLTMLIIPLSLIDFDKPLGEFIGDLGEVTRDRTEMSRLDYLFTQFRVIITYMRLIFIPLNQNILYDYPVYRSFSDVPVIVSFVTLLLVIGLAFYLCSRSRRVAELRMVSFGIFWFFLTLSVESSIIPILGVIYEHRVYLPSIGGFLAIITSVLMVKGRFRERQKIAGNTIMVVLTLAVIVLTGAAYMRNSVWKDSVIFWQDVVKKNSHSARAFNSLGLAYQSRALLDKAIRHYQIATQIDPSYEKAHNNLGNAYQSQGLMDRAIQHLQTAVTINPYYAKAHNNLGVAYKSQGLMNKAIRHLQIAIEINPRYPEAFNNLGNVYYRKGNIKVAIRNYRLALNFNPRYAKAYNNLGLSYSAQGLFDNAIEQYKNSLKLKPDFGEAHYNIAVAYRTQGLLNKSNEHFRIARKLNPALFRSGDKQH